MPRNRKGKSASGLLLALGLLALVLAIFDNSSILAFIGLGLTFWGALTLYVATDEYVKKSLLDQTIISSLADLDQILTELEFKGKPVYLPPEYSKDFETTQIYISKDQNMKLPTPGEMQGKINGFFLENPKAAVIVAPGFSLSRLFEKTLGTSFTGANLDYLKQNLPKLFIEDLEIAGNLEIQTEYGDAKDIDASDIINVKITNSIYKDTCRELEKATSLCDAIGCPLCSAIACALAKATGKPITIEKVQSSADGKTIEATYRLQKTAESAKQTEMAIAESSEAIMVHSRRSVKVASSFLIALGSIVLGWIGWLTWNEVMISGKDLYFVFFSSRTQEAISLGIGMKVIYYFFIGLVLILSGSVVFRRRKQSGSYKNLPSPSSQLQQTKQT